MQTENIRISYQLDEEMCIVEISRESYVRVLSALAKQGAEHISLIDNLQEGEEERLTVISRDKDGNLQRQNSSVGVITRDVNRMVSDGGTLISITRPTMGHEVEINASIAGWYALTCNCGWRVNMRSNMNVIHEINNHKNNPPH